MIKGMKMSHQKNRDEPSEMKGSHQRDEVNCPLSLSFNFTGVTQEDPTGFCTARESPGSEMDPGIHGWKIQMLMFIILMLKP